jgi:uncharacterized coiled-coil DUF342 family protein
VWSLCRSETEFGCAAEAQQLHREFTELTAELAQLEEEWIELSTELESA